MISPCTPIEPSTEPYKKQDFRSNLRFDRSKVLGMVVEFLKLLSHLCYVRKDGSSEWEWDEELYARVKDLAHILSLQLSSWEERLSAANAELDKIRADRQQIENDMRDLTMKAPREFYEKALFELNARRRTVELERTDILDVLARVRNALREGARVKWPVGTPKKRQPPVLPQPETRPSCPSVQDGGSISSRSTKPLGSEIEGLLSQGKF